MPTFNGKHENLKFSCKACAYQSTVEIDLDNKDHKNKLWSWLRQHSNDGGKYENVPVKKELCVVCNEQYDATRIVIYTGKPVCWTCARAISKEFMETVT